MEKSETLKHLSILGKSICVIKENNFTDTIYPTFFFSYRILQRTWHILAGRTTIFVSPPLFHSLFLSISACRYACEINSISVKFSLLCILDIMYIRYYVYFSNTSCTHSLFRIPCSNRTYIMETFLNCVIRLFIVLNNNRD